jgi:hypothetical protein
VNNVVISKPFCLGLDTLVSLFVVNYISILQCSIYSSVFKSLWKDEVDIFTENDLYAYLNYFNESDAYFGDVGMIVILEVNVPR